MWTQNYAPIGGSLFWSALTALGPIAVLLYLATVRRKSSLFCVVSALVTAAILSHGVYHMPPTLIGHAVLYGAAFGLFPIGWVVFTVILLYRLTVETGQFAIVKDSIASFSDDRRIQALFIAFGFGAFIEGVAGFGTPVAIASSMLVGLGFSPFQASAVCLLANTAPVAFGSIGIPIQTLAITTGLPASQLSTMVGRLCAPLALVLPFYLFLMLGGWKSLKTVWPAATVCGVAFSCVQLLASSSSLRQLTDILSAIAAISSLILLLRFWRPIADVDWQTTTKIQKYKRREVILAWTPYLILIVLVMVWGHPDVQKRLDMTAMRFGWPHLHNAIIRVPPITSKPIPYPALYVFNWLSASGTACLLAATCSVLLTGMKFNRFVHLILRTARGLFRAELTIGAMLGLAFLLNYSGMTSTLGLVFTHTGSVFPFCSILLGWFGVFLTGSDTSSNALFGNIQVVTAEKLRFSSILLAAANSAGGVIGKMVSFQSIAVASASTKLPRTEEAKLFRFTLLHGMILAAAMGLLAMFYAYFVPGFRY